MRDSPTFVYGILDSALVSAPIEASSAANGRHVALPMRVAHKYAAPCISVVLRQPVRSKIQRRPPSRYTPLWMAVACGSGCNRRR